MSGDFRSIQLSTANTMSAYSQLPLQKYSLTDSSSIFGSVFTTTLCAHLMFPSSELELAQNSALVGEGMWV